MKFVTKSHKQGDIILNESRYVSLFEEVKEVILGISEEDIKQRHQGKYSRKMSLSYAINDLLKERFSQRGWMKEAPIFQDKNFTDNKWRLDFSKGTISIEVGFNHGEAIAWNLIKPVLASELNHVQKAIQTEVGILICATKNLKMSGAFDGAVGEFEKICRYLVPLDRILTVPMLIIGLEAPETFKLLKIKKLGRNIGTIVPTDPVLEMEIASPYSGAYLKLPLFDSVGCGDFMFADTEVQEMVSVREDLVSKGSKYFILRTAGDSMNQVGVDDGDLILCRKNYLPNDGDKVVALVGDDATLKEFHKTRDSVVLKPRSSNPRHKELVFSEGDEIKIQGVMVRVLKDSDFSQE